jgi:Prokaryotic phospholipase A2
VVIDPLAVRNLAKANTAAAETLVGMAFPLVPAWLGIGATVFRARVETLSHRRDELADAHREAGATLHAFAFVAQGLLDDMAWRGRQRDAAQERVSVLTATMRRTTDPVEAQRLGHERGIAVADRERAFHLWRAAQSELLRREKACAHTIGALASIHALPAIAKRLWSLPLADFTAYQAQIAAGRLPTEGVNWTNDGCSDGHRVTDASSDDSCLRHDFGYRNWPQIAATRDEAKELVDQQFGRDLRGVCRSLPSPSVFQALTGGFSSRIQCETLAAEALVGVQILGVPDANERSTKRAR